MFASTSLAHKSFTFYGPLSACKDPTRILVTSEINNSFVIPAVGNQRLPYNACKTSIHGCEYWSNPPSHHPSLAFSVCLKRLVWLAYRRKGNLVELTRNRVQVQQRGNSPTGARNDRVMTVKWPRKDRYMSPAARL